MNRQVHELSANTPPPETGPEVSDQQKLELLERAEALLQAELLALMPDDKLLKRTKAADLRINLALIIEEICINNLQNGPNLCEIFFQEMRSALENNPENLVNSGQSSRFAYILKLKLMPLYLARLRRLKVEDSTIKKIDAIFKMDKVRFMKEGQTGLQGIPENQMPQWFNALRARTSYQNLLARAVTDPAAESLRKAVHNEVSRELNGEAAST